MASRTLLLFTFATIVFTPVLHANEDEITLQHFRDVAETRNYTLGRPVSPRPTPDGAAVLFLRGGPRDPVLRLYELDVATGRERELITPAQLLGSSEETLTAEEKSRRERTRTLDKGFTKFDLSKDGARLLVTLSGQLYLVDRATLKVTALPGKNWIDPRFAPDGTAVAAVTAGELHVIELAMLVDHTLTSGASDTLTHGTAEFVAQEEMDRFEGYWWSPDSQSLAYQETDESGVEIRYIADPLHPETAPAKNAYPHAGSPNAQVRLGVIARTGGTTRWITWDAVQFPYLARVVWKETAAPLTLLVQNRAQQDERLLAIDLATGTTRELLRETDPAWLNLDNSPIPTWLKDGHHFLWSTERRGAWQLELRDVAGALVRELTPVDFGYRSLIKVDENSGLAYVLGSADPRDTQVWKFPLAGGSGSALTSAPGRHQARLADDGHTLVHTYDLRDGSWGAEVLAHDGHRLAQLTSLAEQPATLPRVEFTRTTNERAYYAAIVRPHDFQTGQKYPVILSVYAGPHYNSVTSNLRSFVDEQLLADAGFIVVALDGRGTPGRGRDWERTIRGNFIDVALHDQVEGLQALGAVYPELDLTRVGVSGWSFGGYFSAMATIRRPDIFRCGVVGAPVITWENYDTHYTERYLGLPQEAPEAYRISNVTTYANQLARPLLLIHGFSDDNVYFQHTAQLANALFLAGKPYEFMPMLGTHMASAETPVIRLREQQRQLDFFRTHLRIKSE